MKKIWLIAFFFNMVSLYGFTGLKNQTASCKISFDWLELKAAVKNPFEKAAWNYGVMLTSKQFIPLLPVTFKAGTLSAGGSLSRLNTPELSETVSAFGVSRIKLLSLEASLPSDTSFSKPPSLYLQAEFGNKKIGGNTSFFYDSSSFTSSLTFNTMPFSLPQKLIFSCNLTTGIYSYKSNTRSTWFNTEDFYHQGAHICSNSQICISYGKNTTLFTLSTYENPFGKYQNTYRTETFLQFDDFSFSFNSFINQNRGLITSSGKTLEPVMQFESGWKLKKTIQNKKRIVLTTGFNSLLDINPGSNILSSKTAFGIKITGSSYALSLTSNINLGIKKQQEGISVDFTSGTIKGALGFVLIDFKPDFSCSFSFAPDRKNHIWNYTEKIGLNIEYAGFPDVTWNNTLTLTQKKENIIGFTSSLSAKAQFRFCSLRVHLEFQV